MSFRDKILSEPEPAGDAFTITPHPAEQTALIMQWNPRFLSTQQALREKKMSQNRTPILPLYPITV
jgi:hypothetical protein